MIESCQLWLIQALYDRKNRSVYQTDRRIHVLSTDIMHAPVVLMREVFDLEHAVAHVIEKSNADLCVHARACEVFDFDQHWSWNYQWLTKRVEKRPAAGMVGITSIEGRVNWAGVNYERHGSGS